MTEHTSLKDQVALITGGGTGIGRGIALALAQQGARLVLCGRRSDRIEAALALARLAGAEGLAVIADISRAAEVDRLVQTTLDTYGRIDILVNNATISTDGDLHEVEPAAWDAVMGVNLRGPYLLTRAVLPGMRAQRNGQILNISSESGLRYYPGDSVYGLSKHALNDFSEYVQTENQESNIRVYTICPGMVVTEMTEDAAGLDHNKCLYPEDIAELAVWLLTRRQNIKIGAPILIQTMLNPWE